MITKNEPGKARPTKRVQVSSSSLRKIQDHLSPPGSVEKPNTHQNTLNSLNMQYIKLNLSSLYALCWVRPLLVYNLTLLDHHSAQMCLKTRPNTSDAHASARPQKKSASARPQTSARVRGGVGSPRRPRAGRSPPRGPTSCSAAPPGAIAPKGFHRTLRGTGGTGG